MSVSEKKYAANIHLSVTKQLIDCFIAEIKAQKLLMSEKM